MEMELQLDLEKIKEIRESKKFTLEEMAELFGYKDASTYWKYENGGAKFKADQLPLLAKKLGLTIQDLFFDPSLAELAN